MDVRMKNPEEADISGYLLVGGCEAEMTRNRSLLVITGKYSVRRISEYRGSPRVGSDLDWKLPKRWQSD